MEMKGATVLCRWMVHLALCLMFFLLGKSDLAAQPPLKSYTVKNGRMYIMLGRQIRDASLDSFILQFELQDLDLKNFLKTSSPDSLKKLGWQIDMNNEVGFVISKALMAYDKFDTPADKIIFAEKHPTIAEQFAAENNGILFGYNKFKNGNAFHIRDSNVSFILRNYVKAGRVMLAGSFNNWDPEALQMKPTDSGWVAIVKLGPGKYWYKFIVDGNWIVDPANQIRENDGRGNINSVFYRTNRLFTLPGFTDAKRVYLAGSFNSWRPRELQMVKTESGWELPIYLARGTHTYRFFADGKWMADPLNPQNLPNEFNEFNSVVRIGKAYTFRLEGYTEAKQVVLSGSFNNWREDELFMIKTTTGWELPYTIGPGNYEYRFRVDGKWIHDPGNPLRAAAGNRINSFLVVEPNYTFRLKGFEKASKVFLAGDFNNWNPSGLPMQKQGDEWVFSVHLAAGKHVYKFIVDGEWIKDPANKLWEQNEHGTGNSIIWMESK